MANIAFEQRSPTMTVSRPTIVYTLQRVVLTRVGACSTFSTVSNASVSSVLLNANFPCTWPFCFLLFPTQRGMNAHEVYLVFILKAKRAHVLFRPRSPYQHICYRCAPFGYFFNDTLNTICSHRYLRANGNASLRVIDAGFSLAVGGTSATERACAQQQHHA